MRIINVSTDLNSQKNIAQMGMVPVENKVKSEVNDATRVEAAKDKTAQETQKKGRKTKGVPTEEI